MLKLKLMKNSNKSKIEKKYKCNYDRSQWKKGGEVF